MNPQNLLAKILSILSVLSMSLAFSAEEILVPNGVDQAAKLELFQNQLLDLESQAGPYDLRLMEPLMGMIGVLWELQDYETVAELQNRQLQVVRTTLGLQHPDVLPIIRSILTTQIALGNWDAVSDQLGHIRNLYPLENGQPSIELLHAIDDQIHWLLMRTALDGRGRRARIFMQSRDLMAELDSFVEDFYGDNNLAIAPWLYKSAINKYHLVQMLNATDGVSGDAIDRVAREDGGFRLEKGSSSRFSGRDPFFGPGRYIPVIDRGDLLGVDYLREARNLMDDLSDLAEDQNDLEAQAMANIYYADFQMLMEEGRAIRRYRKAQELLTEKGISKARIDAVFSRPMPIPLPEIFTNFADLETFQAQTLLGFDDSEESITHVGSFTAWNKSVRSTALPVSNNPQLNLNLPLQRADISFNLSSRGKPSSHKIIEVEPAERSIGRAAWRAVKEMKFRPVILDRKAKRLRDVKIRYFFIDEL
jgi:hypothetical protein